MWYNLYTIKSNMSNLYLITGEETYEKNECLEKIKNSFGELVKGINYIVLDKDSISNLESEINTYPFGYSKKLIVVKFDKKEGASEEEVDKKTDFLNDQMQELLSNLDESVNVVFIGDFTAKSKIYKFVEKNGTCFMLDKKKENEILPWCRKLFDKEGVQISNSDISYLINLCGTEKQILKNEIEKLLGFATFSKVVKKEDIDKLCIKTSDIIIFDLTDSLGEKNVKKALLSLNELIENKEPIQKIVIMIAKHFKSLLVAKIATEEGKNLMKELRTKSTYAANKYKEQSRRFKKEELVNIIEKLSKLDIDSKLGKIDLKIGIEKIICGG